MAIWLCPGVLEVAMPLNRQPLRVGLMRFGRGSILGSMLVKPFSRVLALLLAAAYIGATMLVIAPSGNDMSSAAIDGMMHEQDGQGDRMPCKGMVPGCVTDLGCIFLISLAAPDLTLVTVTAWSSVAYPGLNRALRGRTIKPALGPPISLA
jgi:hypothetical protein